MIFLWRRANQKAFTKISTQIKKNSIYETEHDEKLVTDNPVINDLIYLTYWSVVNTSSTSLMPCANERMW